MPSTQKVNNLNFLSTTGFSFALARCPNLTWFVQEINMPGISLGDSSRNYATGKAAIPGDNLEYNELTLTFAIDESMNNWREIYNWMRSLAPTRLGKENNNQYATLSNSDFGRISDGTLLIMTNSVNVNISVDFKDLFPTSLSNIEFRTTDTAIEAITSTVSFRYSYYNIRVNPEYNLTSVPDNIV